jgi:hypothetical protein
VNTHGKKFFVTGRSHVCSDDFFKAQALIAREEELEEKQKFKRTLQAKSELQMKAMALLVEKAACFESNQYMDVSTKDLDLLLQWYDIPKEKMKKADKDAKWREIRTSNTPPPVLVEWTEEDEAELKRKANTEIDMADTYLGRYAATQKKNAVAAVLDFTDEEWESLKQLKENDMMRVGGLADEYPANFFVFFYSGGILKIRRAKKKEKQADHGLTGGSTFDHDLFPPPLPPPP